MLIWERAIMGSLPATTYGNIFDLIQGVQLGRFNDLDQTREPNVRALGKIRSSLQAGQPLTATDGQMPISQSTSGISPVGGDVRSVMRLSEVDR